MEPLPPSLKLTLELLVETKDHEFNCDEAARVLDRYVEQRLADNVDTSDDIRLLEEHLRLCPECREVCEAVLRVLRRGV